MAHAILAQEVNERGLEIDVYSAGVIDFSDQPQLEETSATCRRYQTEAPAESPTFAGHLPLDSIERFLVMEQFHADVLTQEFGVPADRVTLLGSFDPHRRGDEIADPFGLGRRAYQESFELIRDCLIEYLETTDDPFGRPSNP